MASDPEFRPAHPEEIVEWFGAEAGSLGPVGVKNMRILADQALAGRRNMIAGANKDDYHLRHVTLGEDFQAEFHDLRQVAAGDALPALRRPLRCVKTVEIGHIFKLGYKYSELHGPARAERRGQGSDAHHGLLRHRHRAHPDAAPSSCTTTRTAWCCRRPSRRSRW